MENYLITDDTVALLKKGKRTIVYNVDNYKIINIPILKVLNYNCAYYGSNLEGRIESGKEILNITYKVPIVIEESKNLVLIRITSVRNKECLFLVVNKIVDYYKKDDFLNIVCYKNNEFTVSITEKVLEKEIINAIKLNNILLSRKNTKLL